MIQFNYDTKKELRNNIGNQLEYTETSIFGEEYKENGTLTGCNLKRSWFANVIIKDNKILKVK